MRYLLQTVALFALFFSTQSCFAEDRKIDINWCLLSYPEGAECHKTGARLPFSSLELPVTRKDVLQAIQSLATSGYGTAYRNIGVKEDWDHGHILMTDDKVPRAILFHTQEVRRPDGLDPEYSSELRKTDLYAPNEIFNGLDRTKRSWIFFLKSRKLALANRFVFDTKPSDEYESVWSSLLEHYTFNSRNLDPKKLGFKIDKDITHESGFFFHKVECPNFSELEMENGNILQIRLRDKTSTCLYVHSTTYVPAFPK